jgi:hypothetical protein
MSDPKPRFGVDRFPNEGTWIPCRVGPPWRMIWIDSADPKEFDRQLFRAFRDAERERCPDERHHEGA